MFTALLFLTGIHYVGICYFNLRWLAQPLLSYHLAIFNHPGIAGYKLLLEEGDLRQSITVVTPKGKKYPLNYWQVITGGFSAAGEKAEWRVVKSKGKMVPVALIVRVNAHENPDNVEKTTSYLAVAKITAQKICVTDKINPGAGQNEEARRAADASANKSCLE